jgi:hypothetical protein
MSRSLKPTRPVSSRLIFDPEDRITLPASSRVIRRSSRNRRSRAPSSLRGTVGPAPAGTIPGREAAPSQTSKLPCG